MASAEETIQKIREYIHSDDPHRVILGLRAFKPNMGRFRITAPLDEYETSIIPDIQGLLDDRRLCCLTPIVRGVPSYYYGEVRWYAAMVLAEFYTRRHSTESLILRDVLCPFENHHAQQIARENGIQATIGREMELYELLREKGLLRAISEIDLGGDGQRGLVFILGWFNYFGKKQT